MYVNDVQAKIVILYAIRGAGQAISMDQLSAAVITDDILDYFSLMHYFHDLMEYGYIKQVVVEDEPRYEIEPKGLEAVSLFYNRVPLHMRRKIERRISELPGMVSKPMEIRTGTTLINDRQYIAKCGIYEWNTPLLEINITVADKYQASQITRYFEENATEVYKRTLGVLGQNLDGTI